MSEREENIIQERGKLIGEEVFYRKLDARNAQAESPKPPHLVVVSPKNGMMNYPCSNESVEPAQILPFPKPNQTE